MASVFIYRIYYIHHVSGCNVIKTGNFTTCHDTVDPTPYVESCQQETCLCKQGGDCACFCSAVAAYVQECNRHGIPIYWRRDGLCRKYFFYHITTFIDQNMSPAIWIFK